MRTANFRDDVLFGISALLSITPNPDLSPEFAAQWTYYINTRVRQAWDYYDWPELMVTEERAFRAIYRSDQTWYTGDEVCYLPNLIANGTTSNNLNVYFRAVSEVPEGANFSPVGVNGASYWVPLNQSATFQDGVSTATSNIFTSASANFTQGDKNQPFSINTNYFAAGTTITGVTNATTITLSNNALLSGTGLTFSVYGRSGTLDKYIAYDQVGARPIGECYGAYNFNPRLRPWLTVPGLYFRPSEKGIDIAPFSGNSVFIWYKTTQPKFTTVPWAAGTYLQGQSVYWTDGNCYQVAVKSTTTDPTDNTSWFQIQFPAFLVDFVKTSVAADASDDARTTQLLLGQSEGYLNEQIDKLMAQGHAYRYALRKPRQVWLPYGLSNFWWSAVVPWQGSFVTTITDTYFSPIPLDRRPAWITDALENIVDEQGNNIVAA